jgi:hypothetical protein
VKPALRLGAATLALAFVLTRFSGLGRLPIFLDESVHLRWAFNVAQGDKLFRPWADGRLLTIWLYALVLPHVQDFLFWARALSGLSGAATLVLVLALARRFLSEEASLLAGFLYVLCPFTLLYDRMALTDSYLAAGAALVLLLTLRARDEPTPLRLILLGLALAGCVLVKFSGILLFLVPPLTGLLLGVRGRPIRDALLVYLVALLVLGYPLAVFARSEMLKVVVAQAEGEGLLRDTLGNALLAARFLAYYWGVGLVLLAAAGLPFALRDPMGRLLAVLVLLPLLVVVLVLRVWYARYVLWATIPLLLLASQGAQALARRGRGYALLAFFLLAWGVGPLLVRDLRLVGDPPRAGLPPEEDAQYVNGWPSGYGVREVVTYLTEELRRNPGGITVFTHYRSHRAVWNALDLYFQDEPRFHLDTLDFSYPDAVPYLLSPDGPKPRPVYVVLSPRFEGAHPSTVGQEALAGVAQRVAVFRKPDGTLATEVWRLGGG